MNAESSTTWASAPLAVSHLPRRSGAAAAATTSQTNASATAQRAGPPRPITRRSTTVTQRMASEPPSQTGVSNQ